MSTFEDVKNSLLCYYGDCQSSSGTRLLGYIVALFTLVEVARIGQSSNESWLKFSIFFSGIVFLMIMIVRTSFRYAAFSGFCSYLIDIWEPTNFGKNSKGIVTENVSKHAQVNEAFVKEMEERGTKVFWLFDFELFVTCSAPRENTEQDLERRKKETTRKNIKGWFISFAFGWFLAALLLVLLF